MQRDIIVLIPALNLHTCRGVCQDKTLAQHWDLRVGHNYLDIVFQEVLVISFFRIATEVL